MNARICALCLLAACGGGEADRVELPVVTDGRIAAFDTDLGYAVSIDRLRIAVADLQMTVEGERHATARSVRAPHPGHSAGGEVTGELLGDLVLTWDGAPHPLGDATLLVGDYQGANLAFRAAGAGDVAAGDPLLGHTFHLTGSATRDGATVTFDAVLDIEPGTTLVGAVFDHVVTAGAGETLRVAFLPVDPSEGDTPLDGIAFAELARGDDGVAAIRPGDAAHNVLRRQIQIHDHYAIEAR